MTGTPVFPLIAFLVSMSAVLFSQFGLDGLADSVPIVHWIQHGLLFGGGVVVGLALVELRRSGRERA